MSSNTPFHMRDDSDPEDIDDNAKVAGGGGIDPKAQIQKDVKEIAGGLKQLFGKKQPRLGNVEVHPDISKSSCPSLNGDIFEGI